MSHSLKQLYKDLMETVVTCKYCGGKALYGNLTWLNGKYMCPECYKAERAAEDKRLEQERQSTE